MATVNLSLDVPEFLDNRRKRSAHAAGSLGAYTAFCLVCFALAYVAISRREAVQSRFLTQSTFAYSGRDQASAAQAVQLTNRFHLQTLDLHSPEAGQVVYRLSGTHQATSPTLFIPTKTGIEIISGQVAVSQALQPFSPQDSPFQKAKWALAFMAALILLAVIFEGEISKVAAYLPLLGIVAVAALWGRCLHCSAGGSMLSTLAPILGLIYLGGGGVRSLPGPPVPKARFI